jgi:uncharacterized protein
VSTAEAFHAGERALQERAGVREQLAFIGGRVIRDHMPNQHRDFFTLVPFILAGTVDAGGQPWASVLAGEPGFIESPDPQQLVIHARPLPHDPLNGTLRENAPIGLLGIQQHTRRRNRMNGFMHLRGDGIAVEVGQSFGNCPKYIQARAPEFLAGVPAGVPAHDGPGLDEASRSIIRAADTFFIATSYPQAWGDSDVRHGVDVSHRGGKPGFVKVGGDTLTVPDFVGNNFFNTLGNIEAQPKAGLLFVDFETGDALYLAVRATIVWDGPEVEAFEGAQRLLKMEVTHARRVEAGLPLRWGKAELSPFLAPTGQW